MENRNWKSFTAAEAKKLSQKPSRMLNVIFRNIKEAAELGENSYMYSDMMSDETAQFAKEILQQEGFTVEVGIFDSHIELVPGSTSVTATVRSLRMANILVTW